MAGKPEREYPLTFTLLINGEFSEVYAPEFTAWLMDLTPDEVRAAYALHGKIPAELAAKAKRKRDRFGGEMSDAIEAYMRGEE